MLPRLRAWVSQAGLERYFDFRGHLGADQRDELVRLYQKAWVFVLPSYHEGMPTVLLEAMASGLPVVSTAVGGAKEVLVNGENGLLVPPRDSHALAYAMRALLENAGLRDYLGRNARETVERCYSWDAIGERYVACYERVLSDRR
jgi:glycosyltransferase involved in cell wall biosynthesis